MVLQSEFRAPWWLRSPHAQTLFAAIARNVEAPKTTSERLFTLDDDFLDLHWFGELTGPLVLVFHGLQGSSRSNYARGLIRCLSAQGLGGAVMHFRGCSGEPNRQQQSYHCAHTCDIAWVLDTIARRHPQQALYTVGYSIGGAALLNTLALETLPPQLQLSMAVSPPFEPRSGANRMNHGFSRVYQRHLVADCVQAAQAKLAAGVSLPIDKMQLQKAKSFWEFDHHVTAPLHGFNGADDYYDRAAPRPRLKNISSRCHIIHAQDDPFFEPTMIPEEHELGINTTLEICSHGGHVGFVSGKLGRPYYWLENRLCQLINENLCRV